MSIFIRRNSCPVSALCVALFKSQHIWLLLFTEITLTALNQSISAAIPSDDVISSAVMRCVRCAVLRNRPNRWRQATFPRSGSTKRLPELRSLTHALNEMLERLSRGFDAQRQFVGNAAHELRTPLTLLQTQLELFPDGHPDIPPESAAFLAALQDEVQQLSRLTHALLDMSDLQSVPRNDVILLSPMIDEVFADLAPLAERNGISLSREGENITVVGSDMLLCRMFSNLVENAVKYNHPGGMVKVDVQQRDRQAVIHVADTGRGIPQEFWQSIFQPFFRVDKSLSRELGGAGLGLPLVWEIARLHGGRVWVEESNDNGSALAVTLLLSASITDTVRR